MFAIKNFYFGARAAVYILAKKSGRTNFEKDLATMDMRTKAKIAKTLQRFCDRGQIERTEQFKYEGNGLYAFKIGQLRLLGFFLPGADQKSQLVVHHYWKQSKKAPRVELEKAKKLRDEILKEGYEYAE